MTGSELKSRHRSGASLRVHGRLLEQPEQTLRGVIWSSTYTRAEQGGKETSESINKKRRKNVFLADDRKRRKHLQWTAQSQQRKESPARGIKDNSLKRN